MPSGFVRQNTGFKRVNLFGLYFGRVTKIAQQVGKRQTDKRLVCSVEMSSGGIHENVPFFGGGVDVTTKMPHGIFAPPRIRQMVGVMFHKGRYDNPIACFPVPHPDWAFNAAQIQELYNEPMEDVEDIAVFHFSGSRMFFRKDGTFEFAFKKQQTSYKMNLKIEDTDKKKTFTDLDNNHVIIFKDKEILISDSNGNEFTINDKGITIIDTQNNMIEMTSHGIKVTDTGNNIITMDKDNGVQVVDKDNNKIEMTSSGMKLTDKNNNTIEMKAGEVAINGTNCEVLQ